MFCFCAAVGEFEFKVPCKCEGKAAPLEQNHYPSPDKVSGKDTDVSSLLPRVQPSSALGAEVFLFSFFFCV